MEWKVIAFTIACIATLACMWRGGPCAPVCKRCKEKLLKGRRQHAQSPTSMLNAEQADSNSRGAGDKR